MSPSEMDGNGLPGQRPFHNIFLCLFVAETTTVVIPVSILNFHHFDSCSNAKCCRQEKMQESIGSVNRDNYSTLWLLRLLLLRDGLCERWSPCVDQSTSLNAVTMNDDVALLLVSRIHSHSQSLPLENRKWRRKMVEYGLVVWVENANEPGANI